jgi:uncharacterized protein (UPF0128 family)
MLSDSELDALRTQLETLTLVQTVIIERLTETISDTGGVSEADTTVATVSGRLDPFRRGASDYIIGDQEKGRAYYQVTVEHDADLRDGDKVTVGGTEYRVLQVHAGNALAAVKRALAVKIG